MVRTQPAHKNKIIILHNPCRQIKKNKKNYRATWPYNQHYIFSAVIEIGVCVEQNAGMNDWCPGGAFSCSGAPPKRTRRALTTSHQRHHRAEEEKHLPRIKQQSLAGWQHGWQWEPVKSWRANYTVSSSMLTQPGLQGGIPQWPAGSRLRWAGSQSALALLEA